MTFPCTTAAFLIQDTPARLGQSRPFLKLSVKRFTLSITVVYYRFLGHKDVTVACTHNDSPSVSFNYEVKNGSNIKH